MVSSVVSFRSVSFMVVEMLEVRERKRMKAGEQER